ncbi:SurA N-terminal domain-containing protein [Candidatus Pelagibacter sp. Uisw_127]|uniref:SurA N-terminal domain-containing protein n=1 Tax=Candidatus Pelagibacter sp. Uisw_127 TaxID=3230988 RepID=UPI0039E97027
MINPFKDFTKKKIGGLLLILVIIIAFGFGGFGGGFSTGNQNNIAKINNTNISTQDFMNYLNESGLSQQVIKENIDKNIIEELLSTLVSTTLLDLEIKELDLSITEDVLIKKIKSDKNFHDENGVFQRTLYEKFLLTNNTSAPMFEIRLKNNELQKQLFTYISGGTKSPEFLVNKFYKEKNKKLKIDYINLDKFYKKAKAFTGNEIKFFVKENADELKQDYIDFSYVNISPKNLVGVEEFNQAFFDKIDDIENQISKNIDFITIVESLNLSPTTVTSYINLDNEKNIKNKIYNSRKDQIEILEDSGTYIFYNIDNLDTKLPSLEDDKFKNQIKNLLFQKEKYEFNKRILDNINKKKFNQTSFDEFGKNNIEKIKFNSIKDNKKFENNSIEILYSLPINSFTLIADKQNNVFIAKTVSYEVENITKNSINFNKMTIEEGAQSKNGILSSYDLFLNNRYQVIVNEKTLDRVKNYFK